MENELIIPITAFTLGILIAVYNGLFILDQQERNPKPDFNKKYRDMWHAVGLVMRALLIVILLPYYTDVVIQVFIVGVLYDVIVNLIIGQKWYFRGTTAWTDRNIPNGIMWTAKLVWVVILIIEIWQLI